MAELENKEIVGMQDDPAIMIGEVPDEIPVQSIEHAIALKAEPAIDYSAFKATESGKVEDKVVKSTGVKERFFTQERAPESTMGTAEALWTVGNTLGLKMYYPELRTNNDVDPAFDSEAYMAELPEEDRWTVRDARNAAYANSLLSSKEIERDALSKVDELPWYGKYPGLIGVGLADPVNLAPIGGVLAKTASAWKTYDRLNRIKKAGAIGAATGAVSNVAAEFLMEAQGRDVDYVSSAFLGVLLGGGLGGIAGSLSHPIKGKDNAEFIVDNNSFLDTLEIDPTVTSVGDLAPGAVPMFKSGVPKAPSGGILFPKFLKSDIQLMAEHASDKVRSFGYMFGSPTNAARDSKGVPIAIKDTAWDRVTQWSGDKQKADLEVTAIYTEARKAGYRGSFDDMMTEVSIAHRAAATIQNKKVSELVEANYAIAEQELRGKEVRRLDTPIIEESVLPSGRKTEGITISNKNKEGGTTAVIESEEIDSGTLQVYNSWVDETVRGKGYGRGLYTELIEEAERKGYSTIVSDASLSGSARKVWEKLDGVTKTTTELQTQKGLKGLDDIPDSQVFTADNTPMYSLDIKAYRKAIGEAVGDTDLTTKLKEVKKQLRNDAYELTPGEFVHDNPFIAKGAETYNSFYVNHLSRMQQLNMKGVEGIHTNRLYLPRIYNNAKIRGVDDVSLFNTVREAIKNDPANAKVASDIKALDRVTKGIVKNLKSNAAKDIYLDYSYLVPKELPNATHLKGIKIKLDDATMGDLLVQNSQDLSAIYSYKMTRQQAIQYKFGTTDLGEIRDNFIQPIHDELIETKGDMSIVKAMENAMSDVLGTLRMAKDGNAASHVFARVTGAYDAATFGGTFGANIVAEVPTAHWATGFRNVFNSQYKQSLGAVRDILFKETKANNWEFANELIGLGHMSEALRASNAHRMTDMDPHFSANTLERGLNSGVDTMFKYNGLRAGTAALEAVVSSNAIQDIPRLRKAMRGNKLSTSERNRIARWGLDEKDINQLADAIETNMVKDKNGKLQSLALEKWDQDSVDLLSMATNRVVDESIIQVDTLHIPTWMKLPKPMTKLLTRFLRYPIAAHGLLLQRGVTDDKAGLIANAVGGIMMYGMYKYLQEQAQLAVGHKSQSDMKFDIFNDEEAWERLIIKSTNYSGSFGFTTVILDHAMTLMGQEQLGTEYRQGALSLFGPTASRAEGVQTLGRALITGEWTGTKDYNTLKSFLPSATMPGISELLDISARELDIKR